MSRQLFVAIGTLFIAFHGAAQDPGASKPPSKPWTGSIGAGLALTSGAYAYDYKTRPPSPEVVKGDSALFAALLFKF